MASSGTVTFPDAQSMIHRSPQEDASADGSDAPLHSDVLLIRFERSLAEATQRVCGHDDSCPQLTAAMRYGMLSPGKRVRPMLALLTAVDFGADPEPLMPFAVALEMVHCASLMLDDLPIMDDAQMRRGQPAAHVEFGEAVTTLAGVGLLSHAFGEVARAEALDRGVRNELVGRLSSAVGSSGLVSGQSRDLGERRGTVTPGQLARIHRQKTAVLFELAVVGGGLHAGLGAGRLDRLQRFAAHIGLAFQTADDLLDSTRYGAASGKDMVLDRDKSGSVHRLGERALCERLDHEMAIAEKEMMKLDARGRALAAYVRALFDRYLG